MKRLLTGCLIVLLLGGAALGVGLYFVYRAATPVIQNAGEYLDRFARFGELEKNIKNQAPFSAPKNNELTKDQLQRFARVQEHVRTSLGQRFSEIENKYKHLKRNADGPPQPSFVDWITALKDLSGVLIDARRAQVDALNETGFSSAEYTWVRSHVYQAAGIEAAVIRIEMVADAARRGGFESIQAPKIDLDVPLRNRELVKPYLRKMDDWLPLMFFGL